MKENCIVSVGIGVGNGAKMSYADMTERLRWSLIVENGYRDGFLSWSNSYPPKSPTHQAVPYGFKPYAIEEARRKGFKRVLWLDSSIRAIKPIEKVFEHIKKNGWLLYYNGFNCGEWTTDSSLKMQGLTRDEACKIPDFTGCCMGFDFENDTANEFLKRWMDAANDGVSFIGPWKNINGECSKDPRCKGHRHDQVIGSIIAHKLGMKIWGAGSGSFFGYNGPWIGNPECESICLVNK